MTKKEIRNLFKAKREKFSKLDIESQSKAIVNRAIDFLDLSQKKVSVFLPIERLKEINTFHLIEQVAAEFYVPVISGENSLKHIKYSSAEQLEINSWGIPEPVYGEEGSVKDLDVVLVPLLAVDQEGNRVGYGKGFYDEFLSQCRNDCLFIGLSYFDPISKINGVRNEDVKLHGCITPKGHFSF